MNLSAAALKALTALQLSPTQLGGVLSVIADLQQQDEERRANQRQRKARSRAASRDKRVTVTTTVTGQERDGHSDSHNSLPDKERSPAPPKEINPSSRSENNYADAREDSDDIELPGFLRRDEDGKALHREFEETFWPAWPHKVGKPVAERAFSKARSKATLDAIMAGVASYIAGKPADRPWLNPATFLNQERWGDEPAAVTPRPAATMSGGGYAAVAEHLEGRR